MKQKIGVGIITCRRPEFFKECLTSIPRNKIDELVVINDTGGSNDGYVKPDETYHYIANRQNKGVGISKNMAMRHLLNKDCTDIFIIEDDITVKNENVFEIYIKHAKKTGLQHMMFGYHGPANRGGVSYGKIKPRVVIDYGNDIKIALNQHCVGAFCYYTRECLKKSGLMDERFKNCWEHVHHSYKLVRDQFCPAYWWWPDVSTSCDLLGEQACSEDNSSIRREPEWNEKLHQGMEWFKQDFGVSPVQVPDTSLSQVKNNLKMIYGRSV